MPARRGKRRARSTSAPSTAPERQNAAPRPHGLAAGRTPARASLRDSPSARGIPTGVAPIPRYYDLIRLLRSLSLVAVLPSSLAELSKHAATFAPPRPLTPKSSRCGGVGFTHTETLTTRKHLTRLYVGSSLVLRPIPLSGKTPAHRSRTRLCALRVVFGEVPSERTSPFCGASLHGLLGPSGYPLASLGTPD